MLKNNKSHIFVRSGFSGKDMHTQRKLMTLTPVLQAIVWTGTMVIVRVIIAIIGGISVIFALNPPQLIYTLIMFAIAIVMPLFPILVCAIYWGRASAGY